MLWGTFPAQRTQPRNALNFVDWSEQNRVFAEMAAVSGGGRVLTTTAIHLR
jgi:hypothetical protein